MDIKIGVRLTVRYSRLYAVQADGASAVMVMSAMSAIQSASPFPERLPSEAEATNDLELG